MPKLLEIEYIKTSETGRKLRRQILQVPDGWVLSDVEMQDVGPRSLRGYQGGWHFPSKVYKSRAKAEKRMAKDGWALVGEVGPRQVYMYYPFDGILEGSQDWWCAYGAPFRRAVVFAAQKALDIEITLAPDLHSSRFSSPDAMLQEWLQDFFGAGKWKDPLPKDAPLDRLSIGGGD